MNPAEAKAINEPDRRVWIYGPEPEYRVHFSMTLSDARALWRAAREQLLQAPGGSQALVEETIGSEVTPAVSDCIALLCAPRGVAGCSVNDFWVDSMPGLPEPIPGWQ
ncbi:hypothetical protein KY084_06180 [Stakelama sp. CBK3Z-3]|uniref:Uncharacterized protein n=1 Tax=Stakelama flava TaxID=2860338 RepID=A0ABS6XJT3_9SPHN|nr:hypothetical protein [Stakelama flava]MBW4330461.1 hypothetical protein [Stakelama flava]